MQGINIVIKSGEATLVDSYQILFICKVRSGHTMRFFIRLSIDLIAQVNRLELIVEVVTRNDFQSNLFNILIEW